MDSTNIPPDRSGVKMGSTYIPRQGTLQCRTFCICRLVSVSGLRFLLPPSLPAAASDAHAWASVSTRLTSCGKGVTRVRSHEDSRGMQVAFYYVYKLWDGGNFPLCAQQRQGSMQHVEDLIDPMT